MSISVKGADSLGKQGLYVTDRLDPYDIIRYLNYLIQAVQQYCDAETLAEITVKMDAELKFLVSSFNL